MQAKLQALIEPVVTGLGYELVGVEFVGGSGNSTLRVFIDAEDGVTVDDCQKVSYQVSGLLDVEDPVKGKYALEISSPGADRPLFTAAHYEQFKGHTAKVRTLQMIEGQRNFRGVIMGIEEGQLVLDCDQGELRVSVNDIEKANLVPDFK